MSKVERIESEITAAWDRQPERDVQAGQLDALADEVSREPAAGKTEPI